MEGFTESSDGRLHVLRCDGGSVEAKDRIVHIVCSSYIIECCTEGWCDIIMEGKQFRIKAGDCYVIMPNTPVYYISSRHCVRSELTCFAKGLEVKTALIMSGITKESPFAPPDAFPIVCEAIQKMIKIDSDHSASADYLRTAELYKIFAALVKSNRKTETTSIISKAVSIIESKCGEDISVDYLAKQVGLERSYFSVLFRKNMGVSPHAYLNSIRVKRACTLMLNTDLSLSEIASQLGMDPTGFSRMFKREMGISPSEYKQKAN